MADTEGTASAVRDVVRALTPMGLWWSTVTAFTGLVAWSYQGVPWADWPPPFRILAGGWCLLACFVPVYIALTRAAFAGYEVFRNWKESQAESGEIPDDATGDHPIPVLAEPPPVEVAKAPAKARAPEVTST